MDQMKEPIGKDNLMGRLSYSTITEVDTIFKFRGHERQQEDKEVVVNQLFL